MITAIPNQPLDFIGSTLLVDCPDKRLPLLAELTDIIRFQVAVVPPTGQYAYGDALRLRLWDVVFDWGGPGSWVSFPGSQCATSAAAGGYIEPLVNTFNPDLGGTYLVEIDVPSITGTSTFTMGDQVVVLSAPGVQSFTIIAASTTGPRITLDTSDSRIVEVGTDVVISEITSGLNPEQFTVSGDVLGVTVPLFNVEAGQCIYIRITHACQTGENTLCSQPIKVESDCGGTIMVRACLDHDAMGFAAPAIFEARLRASLIRPRWEFDTSEERWSDGTINRYYVDRQRTMDFMVQPVDEVLHPFLAALCMFDHVYLNNDEFSVDEGYEPEYGEQSGTAAALLTVRPKRELMRRVTCDDPGPGCSPLNDPPCAEPNIRISQEYDFDEGGRMLTVNVYSAIGFLPGDLTVYVDGVEFASDAWVSPTEFIYGPIPVDDAIRVELTNSIDPECNYVWECPAPRIDLDQVIISGQLYVTFDFYSIVGYPYTGYRVIVNGTTGPFIPQAQILTPSIAAVVVMGPYDEGDVVVLVIETRENNGCTYMSEPITIGGDPAFSQGGLNDEVFELRLHYDGILVGGNFTLYDVTTANRFTKLNINGTLDTDFNTNMGTGFNNAVRNFDVGSDGSSYVVGSFTQIDGMPFNRIAKIGIDGTPDGTFSIGTGFNNTLASGIAMLPSGSMAVTGNFTTFNGLAAPGIAVLLPTGPQDGTFTPTTGFNGTTGLVIYDAFTDTLLVSCNTATTYNGTTIRTGTATIVRINLDGSFNSVVALATDMSDPQFNSGIRGMSVMADGRIVVTGDFTIYDGTAVGHIAVLNPDGTLDTAFMTGMGTAFDNWTTRSKVQTDGKIVVGVYNATTTDFDGADAYGMVRLETDGTRDATFNTGPGFNGRTGPSDEDGTNNYVGGNFTELNSTSRAKVARLPFP